jgi:mono/diheme cytochrome c family protein
MKREDPSWFFDALAKLANELHLSLSNQSRMRHFLLALFLSIFFFNCSSEKESAGSLLTPGALPEVDYRIDSSKDTVLRTAGGALISIDSGSLSGNSVVLKVREAYRLSDMIRGGLFTRSGRQLLQSGGMIQITAAGGTSIQKPIKVSIPTASLDPKMQVYKGAVKDGAIDWKDPQPLGRTEGAIRGELLFEQNCRSCHSLDKTLTGPALRGFRERGPWKDQTEVYKFIASPARYMYCNPYAKELQRQFGAIMPSYPMLTSSDVDDITEYLDTAFDRSGSFGDSGARKCWDSCRVYNGRLEEINALAWKRELLIAGNGSRVSYERRNAPPSGDTVPGRGIPKVAEETFASVYYKFEIESFGWYNIDQVYNLPGAIETDMIVHIPQEQSSEYNIYIALPEHKVFSPGGRLPGATDAYGFLGIDGKLLLPPGTEVVVFAISEKDGKILFDVSDFKAASKNEIRLEPKEISQSDFNAAVKRLDLKDIRIAVRNSPNEIAIRQLDDSIRRVRSTVEKLKPVNCACSICPSDALPAK